MNTSKKSPALFWFYILVVYIFLQFGWWAYLMLDLNKENARLNSEITLLKSNSVDETHSAEQKLHEALNKKRIMVISEGAVFLLLLFLGVNRVLGSFRKEAEVVRQQRNFLLSITHELKSPIASNRLQLETLLKRDLDKDKQKQILENAIEDIDRLNTLVENILLSAQFDQSRFTLTKEKVNVSEFLFSTLQRPLTSSQNKLNLVIEKDIFLPIDKMYFTSIIINLIDNAVKYSPDESSIKVELKKHNCFVLFSVSDNGPGIAPEERAHIFQKFYRIGSEETRKTKGTGLGLYIVKNLVDLHGGTIEVKENSPKGAIFQARFPFV